MHPPFSHEGALTFGQVWKTIRVTSPLPLSFSLFRFFFWRQVMACPLGWTSYLIPCSNPPLPQASPPFSPSTLPRVCGGDPIAVLDILLCFVGSEITGWRFWNLVYNSSPSLYDQNTLQRFFFFFFRGLSRFVSMNFEVLPGCSPMSSVRTTFHASAVILKIDRVRRPTI